MQTLLQCAAESCGRGLIAASAMTTASAMTAGSLSYGLVAGGHSDVQPPAAGAGAPLAVHSVHQPLPGGLLSAAGERGSFA